MGMAPWAHPGRHRPVDRGAGCAYHGPMGTEALAHIPGDWLEEFEAAARRPLAQRCRYAFIRTYKPVLDDAEYRSFDSTAEYRRWCAEHLPSWLGYGSV